MFLDACRCLVLSYRWLTTFYALTLNSKSTEKFVYQELPNGVNWHLISIFFIIDWLFANLSCIGKEMDFYDYMLVVYQSFKNIPNKNWNFENKNMDLLKV